MNTESENKLLHSIDKINKLYDNLSYLDIYGSSVLLFIILTIIVFLVHSYCMIMQNTQKIKDDWSNQRCSPKVIPFAGFINKPDNKTIFEFTEENFNYCIQGILLNISGYALQPFNYLLQAVVNIFNELQQAVNTIRTFMSSLRNNVADMAENVLNRVLNILVPFQQIFIALKDSLSKVQGILTAGLYTSLGTYYALKSFLGAIVQFIVFILIILAALIIGLWILPFTWPTAAVMSAIFLSISIPLVIIMAFMTDVLHIQSQGIPGLPSPGSSSCFDKNTLIKMNEGNYKKIVDIEVGDILDNNNIVSAKIKADRLGQKMYLLNNIIVSQSHRVKYGNMWISVENHPKAILIKKYAETELYCLNTSSKEIIINNTTFSDWDELYKDTLEYILSIPIQTEKGWTTMTNTNDIHFYLDKGFPSDTLIQATGTIKPISQVKIGDFIGDSAKDKVYGIVEIKKSSDTMNLYLEKNNLSKSNNSSNKLYHLLTTSGYFSIDSQIFSDYNSLIDFNLNK